MKPEESPSSDSIFSSTGRDIVQSYNDTYAEWDTLETINAIKVALDIFHDVTMIEADEDAYEKLRKLRPDIVFNISEGANGISREAQIPAMLDMLKIPYTGSDPLTLTTCLDKTRAKEVLFYYKIPTPNFIRAESIDDIQNINLRYPLFIKPVGEGSSKGIFNSSFIKNYFELNSTLEKNVSVYKQPFIIEEYLPGREFTVSLLGNNSDTEILPIVEMNFDELPPEVVPIYSYEAKWIYDSPENPLDIYKCPADLDKNLEIKIKSLALNTFNILKCRDWCRIDIRLDSYGEPNILEVNPLPGVLPNPADNSCFPKAARTAGISYEEMINKVLIAAAKRYNLI